MTASSTKKQGKAVWSEIMQEQQCNEYTKEPETINGSYHQMLCLQETMKKLMHDHLYKSGCSNSALLH